MEIVKKTILLLAVFVNCQSADATVLYQEAFTNEVSGQLPNTAGWRVHTSDFAAPHEVLNASVNLTPSGGDNPATTVAGNPISFGNSLNANPIVTEPGNGFAFLGRSGNFLFWTEEYTITGVDLSVANGIEFSYSHRIDNTEQIRLALRIDSTWFVTDASAVTSIGTNFAGAQGDENRETISVGAESWNALNFDPSITTPIAPSVGSPLAGLPSGDITAFGLFVDDSFTTSTRIDTFTVEDTTIVGPPAPDANGDTFVDLLDLQIVLDNFFITSPQPTFSQGNFNLDATVDETDFLAWRTAFLAGGGTLEEISAALGIPEPGSAAIFVLGILGICGPYRKWHRLP